MTLQVAGFAADYITVLTYAQRLAASKEFLEMSNPLRGLHLVCIIIHQLPSSVPGILTIAIDGAHHEITTVDFARAMMSYYSFKIGNAAINVQVFCLP